MLDFFFGLAIGIFGIIILALHFAREAKPQAETPRFTAPIGLGGGADPLDPHVAHEMQQIFSDLERGHA